MPNIEDPTNELTDDAISKNNDLATINYSGSSTKKTKKNNEVKIDDLEDLDALSPKSREDDHAKPYKKTDLNNHNFYGGDILEDY